MSSTVVITSCVLAAMALMAGTDLVYSGKNVIAGTLIALCGAGVAVAAAATLPARTDVATDLGAIELLLAIIVFMLAAVGTITAIGLAFGSIIYFMSRDNESQHTTCK